MLKATQYILDAWRNRELIVIHVYGGSTTVMGVGKTAYALHVAQEVLEYLRDEPVSMYEVIDSYLVFDPLDFLRKVKELREKGKRIPVLIGDDWGTYLNKMLYRKTEVIRIIGEVKLARDAIAGLIVTSQLSDDIVKELRDMARVKVEVHFPWDKPEYYEIAEQARHKLLNPVTGERGLSINDVRVAIVYGFKSNIMGSYPKKLQIDIYSRLYPFHEYYQVKRNEAALRVSERIKQIAEEVV